MHILTVHMSILVSRAPSNGTNLNYSKRRRINARRIFQKFGVAALNEHIEKHWFQNLKTEDISLCDAPRSDQFSGLNKKALKTDIEEENSLKR
ncbi:hypothetical protein LAZ67_X003722 [Cordylochernes scorpioides]|uniref:Uncharacterized protein n=1 Tax=Cordylochernes scorpioides TaxID=51811 RepID=A0ABY6LZ82_9ARAC|nr:hypothetical protein LAZ67_X003722 [Cordylochernes scorpioides]